MDNNHSNDVVYDKETILNELKQAFAKCSYYIHRNHRVPINQKMEFVKTMTYLSQVISGLEKEVAEKKRHEAVKAENNMLVFKYLEEDGIIQIKDLVRLRKLYGDVAEAPSQTETPH